MRRISTGHVKWSESIHIKFREKGLEFPLGGIWAPRWPFLSILPFAVAATDVQTTRRDFSPRVANAIYCAHNCTHIPGAFETPTATFLTLRVAKNEQSSYANSFCVGKRSIILSIVHGRWLCIDGVIWALTYLGFGSMANGTGGKLPFFDKY